MVIEATPSSSRSSLPSSSWVRQFWNREIPEVVENHHDEKRTVTTLRSNNKVVVWKSSMSRRCEKILSAKTPIFLLILLSSLLHSTESQPQPQANSTAIPTVAPRITSSPSVTVQSSSFPSSTPSSSPSSMPPSAPVKTVSPTISTSLPVTSLPVTSLPTLVPLSFSPNVTTNAPTLYVIPTFSPSSAAPTVSPTHTPTGAPTLIITSTESQAFSQTYVGGSGLVVMSEDKIQGYQVVIQLYTVNYGASGGEPTVKTTCRVTNQQLSYARRKRRSLLSYIAGFFSHNWARRLQENVPTGPSLTTHYLEVDFEMTWSSNKTNVTEDNYVGNFIEWMNSEEGKNSTKEDLVSLGIPVEEVENVRRLRPQTDPPSSTVPTLSPTILSNFTMPPTGPAPETSTNMSVIVGGAIGAAAVVLLLGGTYYFHYHSKPKKDTQTYNQNQSSDHPQPFYTNADVERSINETKQWRENSPPRPPSPSDEDIAGAAVISNIPTSESLVSNPSLLSTGLSHSSDSLPEDEDQADLAQDGAAAVAETKDPMEPSIEVSAETGVNIAQKNLEEEMMARIEKLWGGTTEPMEIEACALYETNDWLKRKESANIDERRHFMQETLNKMVTTVRHNIISPDDASRAIHGCAAMLQLHLAEDIPENTLIITGMRKTVTKQYVISAFSEFGEIDDAAIAPGKRGFGIVRFQSPKSTQRAMEKFKKEEIVVQDVAVTVKVLCCSKEEPLSISNTATTATTTTLSTDVRTTSAAGNSTGAGGAAAAAVVSADAGGSMTDPSSVEVVLAKEHSREPSAASSSASRKNSGAFT